MQFSSIPERLEGLDLERSTCQVLVIGSYPDNFPQYLREDGRIEFWDLHSSRTRHRTQVPVDIRVVIVMKATDADLFRKVRDMLPSSGVQVIKGIGPGIAKRLLTEAFPKPFSSELPVEAESNVKLKTKRGELIKFVLAHTTNEVIAQSPTSLSVVNEMFDLVQKAGIPSTWGSVKNCFYRLHKMSRETDPRAKINLPEELGEDLSSKEVGADLQLMPKEPVPMAKQAIAVGESAAAVPVLAAAQEQSGLMAMPQYVEAARHIRAFLEHASAIAPHLEVLLAKASAADAAEALQSRVVALQADKDKMALKLIRADEVAREDSAARAKLESELKQVRGNESTAQRQIISLQNALAERDRTIHELNEKLRILDDFRKMLGR